jgi:cbb3-type cytochrome oxidase maturation protein
MTIIFFMIGVSLLMALGFLAAFVWSMRTGQQDDLYTPSMRMLLDDTTPYVTTNPTGEPKGPLPLQPGGLVTPMTTESPTNPLACQTVKTSSIAI